MWTAAIVHVVGISGHEIQEAWETSDKLGLGIAGFGAGLFIVGLIAGLIAVLSDDDDETHQAGWAIGIGALIFVLGTAGVIS
ncbi:MAG: hypothetical protein ACXV8R_05305 [Acidimicrobiia bacterium]